jgi:hypothetical protein
LDIDPVNGKSSLYNPFLVFDHDQIDFGGKSILFVSDLQHLSPQLLISGCLVSIAQSQASLTGPQFEIFGYNSQ